MSKKTITLCFEIGDNLSGLVWFQRNTNKGMQVKLKTKKVVNMKTDPQMY